MTFWLNLNAIWLRKSKVTEPIRVMYNILFDRSLIILMLHAKHLFVNPRVYSRLVQLGTFRQGRTLDAVDEPMPRANNAK